MRGRRTPAGVAHCASHIPVGRERDDAIRHGNRVALVNQMARDTVNDRFGNAGMTRRYYGQPVGHGLEDGNRQSFLVSIRGGDAVLDEYVRVAHHLENIFLASFPVKSNAPLHGEAAHELPGGGKQRAGADVIEMQVRVGGGSSTESVECEDGALLRHHPTDGQATDFSPFRVCNGLGRHIDAVGDHMHARRVEAEGHETLAADAAHRDHAIGVVVPQIGGAPFRVVQAHRDVVAMRVRKEPQSECSRRAQPGQRGIQMLAHYHFDGVLQEEAPGVRQVWLLATRRDSFHDGPACSPKERLHPIELQHRGGRLQCARPDTAGYDDGAAGEQGVGVSTNERLRIDPVLGRENGERVPPGWPPSHQVLQVRKGFKHPCRSSERLRSSPAVRYSVHTPATMAYPEPRPVLSFPSGSPSTSPDTLTYEPFFGLSEKPFSLNADLRFHFDSPPHAASLRKLLDGIRRREGLIVLTGEMGTGKTMLCRAALVRLNKKPFSSFVPDPFAAREDLLKTMLLDFGVVSISDLASGSLRGASRTELSYLLAGFLQSPAASDGYAVVVIDEAQNLSPPMIEETRILQDSLGAEGRLQILLVGQLELHDKLKAPEMRQVDQRITSYTRLDPLSAEMVGKYVEHRLRVAGHNGERALFPGDVIEQIHRRSGGVPRLVNRLCDGAMSIAHARESESVDRACLDGALEAIGSETFTPTWASIVFSDRGGSEVPAPPAKIEAEPTPDAGPAAEPTPVSVYDLLELPEVGQRPTIDLDDFLAQLDGWAGPSTEAERAVIEVPDKPAAAAAPVINMPAVEAGIDRAAVPPIAEAAPSKSGDEIALIAATVDTPTAEEKAEVTQPPAVETPAIAARAEPFRSETAAETLQTPLLAETPSLAVSGARSLRLEPPSRPLARTFTANGNGRGAHVAADAEPAVWKRHLALGGGLFVAVSMAWFLLFGGSKPSDVAAEPAPATDAAPVSNGTAAPIETAAAAPAPAAPVEQASALPPSSAPAWKAVRPAAPDPAFAPGVHLVAVGLYVSDNFADRVAANLIAAELPARKRTIEVRGTSFLQVVLGPFGSRADANDALEILQTNPGYEDARVIQVQAPPPQ